MMVTIQKRSSIQSKQLPTGPNKPTRWAESLEIVVSEGKMREE